MRRLWLKFRLWMSGYCTKHTRRKLVRGFDYAGCWTYCPECQTEDYERWQHRLRLMKEEYQELDANR